MPAPDARNDNYSIIEDGLLVGSANGFLNNDSDPDGNRLSITRIDGRPFSFGTPITLASGATLTVNANGSFQYNQNGRFTHLSAGQTANEIFTYSISDGQRGTDTAAVCFTIYGVDPPLQPTLIITGTVAGVVEEEHGLPGGNEDTTDSNGLDTDESGPNTVTNASAGSFASLITGGVDGTLSFAFAPLGGNPAVQTVSTGPLTSDGKQVYFDTEGPNLIGYYNANGDSSAYDAATDTKVFTVTLASTGAYTFTLHAPVHQPIGGEDSIAINLDGRVTVTDSGGPGADTNVPLNASITVIDDTPDAVVANPTAAPIVLDESALPPAGDGIGSATANFSANFAAVAFGTDGAGSASYALALSGTDVASGLYALDATDVSAVDGDGIGQGAQILLNQVGNTIIGTADGTDYFTLAVDPVTGVVTFTQLENIWHDDTSNPDDPETLTLASANLLQLVQTVTDADGDTASAALNLGAGVFTIEDDGPNAEVADPTAAAIVLDESAAPPGGDGIVSATADFSVNFSAANFGTDGAGSARYALVLTGSNVASGLFALDPADTSAGDGDGIGQGAQIVLNKVGNDILGQVDGVTYFTISVDGNGVVTFAQSLNIWHGDTSNHDDPETLTLSDPALLQLTVMDADGDTASAALNLGAGVFTIEDDGPDAVVTNAAAAALVLDETRPVGTETDGDINPAGLDTVTVNLAGSFAPVTVFGSDGPGSATYSLVLAGSNVASGLFALDAADTTAGDSDGLGQGAQIVLNKVGNTITGSVGLTNYFTITLNPANGDVAFTQLLNVWHGNTGNDDDTSTLTLASANLLQLVQTVTDADGDTDTAELDLGTGVFTIEDDGPVAVVANPTAAPIVLDESALPPAGDGIGSATANFSANFAAVAFGTDGAGSASYALALSGTDVASGLYALDATDVSAVDGDGIGQGAQILLNQVGNTIIGTADGTDYFTLAVDPVTGVVTFTQLENIWHDDTSNPDDPETLTLASANLLQLVQTVTDADGDTASAALNLGAGVFTIEDDGPVAVSGAVSSGTVDEDGIVEDAAVGTQQGDGLAGGTGDVAGEVTVASGNVSTLFNSGTDEPLTYAFAANAGATLLALGLTSGGLPLSYNVGATTVTASTPAGNTVFTFTLDPVTGVWTFKLVDQLDHPPLDGQLGDNTENDLLINLGAIVQATDRDGDSVTAAANGLVITVDDDVPDQNAVTANIAVDEDELATALSTGITDGDGTTTVASFTRAQIIGLVASGADEPVTVSLNPAIDNVDTGLDSKGENILFDVVSPTQVNGVAGGREVFTLVQTAGADTVLGTADDAFTFTLLDQVDHTPLATGGGDAETIALSLASVFVATDFDGDSVVIDAGATVTIENDTPIAVSEAVSSGTVDEDGVLEGAAAGPGDGIPGGPGDFVDPNTDGDNDESTTTGTVATLFQSGADEALTYSLSTDTSGLTAQGLTSGGVALTYAVAGNVLTAEAGTGNTVFTFSLNATTGAWAFNLEDQLDHPMLDALPGDNTENDLTILLGSLIQATDFDGDTAPGGAVQIVVNDDTPIATAGTSVGTVDEDGIVEDAAVGTQQGDGLAGGTGDVAGEAVVATGSVTGLFQSGADEPLTYGFTGNAVTTLQALGLTSGGVALSYSIDGDTVTASAPAGNPVFTFQLTAAGNWTFTLVDQLDHAAGNDENDLLITLGGIVQATDRDGDSVIGNATGLVITVDDDTPIATAGTSVGTVDEDGIVEDAAVGTQQGDGLAGGTGDVAGEVTVASGNVSTLFNSGTDEPLTYAFAANAGATLLALGLTSGGLPLSYNVGATTVTASTPAGNTVFTFTLDPVTGAWTFTLVDQLDHPSLDGQLGDNTENDLLINLGAIVQATDRDGDSVTAAANGLVITVDDDVPDQNAVTANIAVDEDELATALSTGITDGDGTTTVASFTRAQIIGLVASGADEPVTVSLNPAIDNVDTGLDSKGENILFDVVSPTQVNGVAGGREVFTLVQTAGADTVLGTADDAFTFTLLDQVDHTPLATGGGDAETIALSLASVFVATDFDGDSVVIDAGATVTIENDTPAPTAAVVTAHVDEDELSAAAGDLSNGITDGDPQTDEASITGASLQTLVTPGADEVAGGGVTAFVLNTAIVTGTAVTTVGGATVFSQDVQVKYAVAGSDIIGFADTNGNGVVDGGEREVFRLSSSGSDFLFDLRDQLDHLPNPPINSDAELLTLNLTGAFTATDFDGDTVTLGTNAITVDVENDVPVPVVPDYAVLPNGAGSPVNFDLDTDRTITNNIGADELGTVRFLASLDGTNSGLTSNSVPIIYAVSPDGLTLTGSAAGTSVFVITLDPGVGTYSLDMNGVVDSVTQVDFNDGGYNFVGGNNPWAEFIPIGETVGAPIDNNSSDLLLTPQIGGAFGGTINSSANSGGVSGGGSIGDRIGRSADAPETFRIDFVTDLRGDPASTGGGDYDTLSKRDHVFDAHYNTNGVSAEFTATSGSTVNFKAINDADADGNVVGPEGAHVALTAVSIKFGNASMLIDLTQPLQPSYNIGGHVFTVQINPDGSINVGGLFADNTNSTQVAIFSAAPGYNAVEYTWVAGDEFKVGNFGAAVTSTNPVNFDVPIEVVDNDGDAVASSIGVTLVAGGENIHDYSISVVGVTATAGAGGNPEPHIIGSNFNDNFTGNAANNVLSGGQGNDILSGLAGNDVLIGGLGQDSMNGGAGNDTYVFTNLADSGNTIPTADVISGWDSTDVIDLSGIDANSSVDGNQALAFVAANTPGTVSNSITWTESGGNTDVSLDTDGIAGAEMMVVLTGIGLNLTAADFIL